MHSSENANSGHGQLWLQALDWQWLMCMFKLQIKPWIVPTRVTETTDIGTIVLKSSLFLDLSQV